MVCLFTTKLNFLKKILRCTRRWHCIGDCTPTHDWGQSEVKRSRPNLEPGQVVKQTVKANLEMVKTSPSAQWAWLMLTHSQGSRPNFQCGQGVNHENLTGQGLDPGCGWEYRPLCSVTPLMHHTLLATSRRGRFIVTRELELFNKFNWPSRWKNALPDKQWLCHHFQ